MSENIFEGKSVEEFLRSSLEEQERLAPRDDDVTKDNHYVPRFFQDRWDLSGSVFVVYANSRRGVLPTSTRATMYQKFLYTVTELRNPNIFEKRRTLFEVPLSRALNRLSGGAYELTDYACGLLISMMLHGSPESVRFYREAMKDHAEASKEYLPEWIEKAMASSFMLQSTLKHAPEIAQAYSFKVVDVFEPLVLSDYPVIQLMGGDQVNPLIAVWHPESSQMILPIDPHRYILATKKETQSVLVDDLSSETVNRFSLRASQRFLIGSDEMSLTVTACREDLTKPFMTIFPMKIPYIHMIPGAMRFFTEAGEAMTTSFWSGYSKTAPPVYKDQGLIR